MVVATVADALLIETSPLRSTRRPKEDASMYTDEIIGFLLRSTIPQAGTRYKNDLVWDAVWRAHRDVLPGRFQLKLYAESFQQNGINSVATALYDHLAAWNPSEELSSTALIKYLNNKFKDEIEYAALLKLVNMTLKYLFILQSFDVEDEVLQNLPPIDLANCDCPLDSNIIKTLSKKNKAIPWTRIKDESEYDAIQKEIREKCLEQYNTESALVYDFMEYPHIAINGIMGREQAS